MNVFKFGGASLKDAASIKNMAQILKDYGGESGCIVVVSAMGKTTNALEQLLNAAKSAKEEDIVFCFQQLVDFHQKLVEDLFEHDSPLIANQIQLYLDHLMVSLRAGQSEMEADQWYDKVVSFGEVISSKITYEYLIRQSIPVRLIEAKNYIRTDSTWRDAKVDFELTASLVKNDIPFWLEKGIVLTQGFLGGTVDGHTTTLGREGSDYSAAIFASVLDAEAVTVWKDVPGVLNADPKRFNEVRLFDELSYEEAAEMTFYGATVIHPKTIKPLANKSIPLIVRSFIDPSSAGTRISTLGKVPDIPAFIVKDQQVLVSFSRKDLSFVGEGGIGQILTTLDTLHFKINLMQRSALSFSVVIDHRDEKLNLLEQHLAKQFNISHRLNLHLLTIKRVHPALLTEMKAGKKIIIEQIHGSTAQLLFE